MGSGVLGGGVVVVVFTLPNNDVIIRSFPDIYLDTV